MSDTETDAERSPTDQSRATVGIGQRGIISNLLPGESPKALAERDRPRQPKPALLVDLAPDTLTLHTRDAYRLFAGRGFDDEGAKHRIIGGQRAAAVLNSLRHVSVGGNPYADWFLLCFEDQLSTLRTRLAEMVGEGEAGFAALKSKGLALNVLGSRQPLELSVAFGSSYGYAIAETMVEFDYYVRVVKTLVLKNRIHPDSGRATIRRIARLLRRLFVRSIRWERALYSPELRDITRQDYLPSADEAARTRVLAAATRFGPLPCGVLDGTILPPHVRRHADTPIEESIEPSPRIQPPDGKAGDQRLL
jgi:integrating conjugative element protein (TIGR03761 family)